MGRRRKAGRRVKRRTQTAEQTEDASAELPPRALVFTKGKVPTKLKQLVEDLKHVMAPNTAQSLKAQKRNKLRDFVDVAGSLRVNFFLVVSATAKSAYLRLMRTPRGPTLTYRIEGYSLAADLAASLRKPYSPSESIWQSAPMLVLSNFDQSVPHQALSATMLQNLFPTLNVATAKLAAFRRVVLVHQQSAEEGGGTQLRQYVIKAAPAGASRGVKKLVRASKLPSLGRYSDLSEFLTGAGLSDSSGGETDDEEKAELPQDYVGRNAKANQKVSIKLQEIGPRITLSLLKVEEGLCEGATLYHSLVSKTEEEEAANAERIEARAAQREERRKEQQVNVDAKAAAVQAKADAKVERRKRRREAEAEGAFEGDEEAAAKPDKSDADWYREEVGEEPDADMFSKRKGGKADKRGAAGDEAGSAAGGAASGARPAKRKKGAAAAASSM